MLLPRLDDCRLRTAAVTLTSSRSAIVILSEGAVIVANTPGHCLLTYLCLYALPLVLRCLSHQTLDASPSFSEQQTIYNLIVALIDLAQKLDHAVFSSRSSPHSQFLFFSLLTSPNSRCFSLILGATNNI